MNRFPLRSVLLSALFAPCAFAQAPGGADPLEGLVRDSPFMPGAAGTTTAQASGPLELRGIIMERGGYVFSIYDQTSRSSAWVKLDEPGYGFVARSFNQEKDELTVEQQGRTMTLALQTSKTPVGQVSAPPPSPSPLPTNVDPNQGIRPGPQPAAASGGPMPAQMAPSDEAQRLQRIADEIRRRRGVGSPVVPPPKR